ALAGSYYIVLEQTIAPLWARLTRPRDIMEAPTSRDRRLRWLDWLAAVLMVAGALAAIALSVIAVSLAVPWVDTLASQVGSASHAGALGWAAKLLAPILVFLISLLATLTALAAMAHVTLWLIKQFFRLLIALGRWQAALESPWLATIAGGIWLV